MFNISATWNIHPYYGHIHRWRRLLEKLYTETKEIWNQNREQLIYIGIEFKRDIEMNSILFLKTVFINEIKTDRYGLIYFHYLYL